MSEQRLLQSVEKNERNGFATAMIALLREYSEKLNEIAKTAERLHTKYCNVEADGNRKEGIFLEKLHGALHARFHRLEPACRHLARNVSQQVEHTDLDEAAKIELRLRLAEFEGCLESVGQVLAITVRT